MIRSPNPIVVFSGPFATTTGDKYVDCWTKL